MKSPYQVLEIEEGASQEEIKMAYRKLVKKYHPDKYENNPLADLAQEKLQEINAAYDTLTKSQGQSQARSQNQQYRQSSQNLDIYNQIRRNIEINNIIVAEQMLDGIANRGAEWNFLKGVIAHKKGWYDQALRYITVAVSLEPGNTEYANGLNNLRSRNTSYRNQGNYRGYSQRGSFCDICSSLLIADCCCECMGGDLISCC